MLCVAYGDIGRRIKKVRESILPIPPKQTWLAEQLGISQSRLSNWERGKHDPSSSEIKKIAKVLGVAEEVLTDGVAQPPLSVRESGLSYPRIPVGFPKAKIRYAGDVPAGDWGDPLASEEFVEIESEFEHPKRFECRVVGMSCYPALHPGDQTIWHSDLNPPPGHIVLAQRKGDHGCTVKELVWDEKLGRNVLHPLNGSESPEDGEGWGVIARLVAVIRTVDGLKKTWYLPSGIRPKHLL